MEINVSVDTASGIYLGTTSTVITSGEGRAGIQAAEVYAGYTARLGGNTSLDAGVIGYAYSRRYSGNEPDQFGEAYVGIRAQSVALYLHYTPNYFDRSVPVLYASASTAVTLGDAFTLSAKAGVLTQTSGPPRLAGRDWRYDTSLTISRPVLGLDTQLTVTLAGPDDTYFDGHWKGRSAVVISFAKHF